VEQFNFFFTFYGLILGLAAAEVLSAIGQFVRVRAFNRIDLRSGLLAALIFVLISVTWIDAWETLQSVDLNFDQLWAPIALATFYYLAATVVPPREHLETMDVAVYYAERKRFVLAMLICAEMLVTYTSLESMNRILHARPTEFWLFTLLYNVLIVGSLIALYFVRSRTANVVLLVGLLVLFLAPYWEDRAIGSWIVRTFGAP
jgi:hypothetical protein